MLARTAKSLTDFKVLPSLRYSVRVCVFGVDMINESLRKQD